MATVTRSHPNNPGRRVRPQTLLLRATGFAALWWILAEGSTEGWALGAVAVALATWASAMLLSPATMRLSPGGFFKFLAFFVWNSLRGGVQVAGMALRGRHSLRPKMLEIRLTLPPGETSVLLVNILGLMPGTLGVELTEDTLLMHVIDERLPLIEETRALEVRIAQLFGSAT